MEGQGYRYDAFISYRHLPLDKAVAVRLQELLEGFRPPKGLGEGRRIERIFRDQSELPTSGDLGADIHEALMSSRYLIVICTERLKESAWCMEEIRQFKEAHEGRTDHILVVLASGEPGEVFPEALLSERYPIPQADGTALWQERAVEPLCCDVRAETTRGALKRLKTESLRVAAPLIGCRYDDLYQRHRRRRRRQAAVLTAGAFSLLTGVLAVVSVFAYRTYLSEKNYRQTLAETYTRQGAGWAEEGKLQEALLYHTSALLLEPEGQEAARLGAAILLEQNTWPYLVREEPGAILDDTICTSPPDDFLLALDRSGTRYLTQLADGYALYEAGEPIDIFPDGMGTFLGSSVKGDYWVFCGEDLLFFYRTEDSAIRAVPRPTQVHEACQTDLLDLDPMPAAMPVADDQAIAVYGGYVYLYDLKEPSLTEKAKVDLSLIFAQERTQDYLEADGQLWVSEDGKLAVVASGFGIAVFNTADLGLKTSFLRYHHYLNHVAVSHDGAYLAFVYGNPFGVPGTDPGGYLEVFDRYGEQILETPIDPETPYEGAVFDPDDPEKLLAWSKDSLHFWDVAEGKEYAVPLKKEGIRCAAFGEDSYCFLYDGDGMLQAYDLLAFSVLPAGSAEGAAGDPGQQTAGSATAPSIDVEGFAQAVSLPDGLAVAHNYTRVCLLDENSAGPEGGPSMLDEVKLDDPVNRMMAPAGRKEVYLFARWDRSLYRAQVSSAQKSFDAVTKLDTRGQVLTDLYPLRDGIAAVTGTGQILFYRPESLAPERTLQLKHPGTVQELRETGNGCLAIRIRTTESAPDSLLFDTQDTTELWDLTSGIHIADLDGDPYSGAESLAFRDIPAPDAETLAFLAALTCCTFDDAQNILSKAPLPDLDAPGDWGSFLTAQSVSAGSANTDDRKSLAGTSDNKGGAPSLGALTADYRELDEDTDPEAWIAETDRIWGALCAPDASFSITELDDWFRIYWHNAQKLGCLDRIEKGILCYIDRSVERELQERLTYGRYDGYLMEMMAETKDLDGIVAAGFIDAADRIEQAEPSTDEMVQAVRQYEASYLRTYGRLLGGEGQEIFADIEKLREKGLLSAEGADLKVLGQLLEGNAETAAGYARADIEDSLYLDVDLYLLEFTWKYSLLGQYVLVQREIIPETVFDRYVRSLPVHMGLEITEATPQALDAGLHIDDLILAANDRYIGCLVQAQELFAPDGILQLKVLRDGQVIDLEMDARTKFTARFRIRFEG